MDAPEPKNLTEFIQQAQDNRTCGDIKVQIQVLNIMLQEINHVYELDQQLTDIMDVDRSYENYDYYMSLMGIIVKRLNVMKDALKKMFPAFYGSSLYKLINIHIDMVEQLELKKVMERNEVSK